MEIYPNPRHAVSVDAATPDVSINAQAVLALLSQCPAHSATPLHNVTGLADRLGVANCWVKDERPRMGLGSFKALGAAYVIACDASDAGGDMTTALAGRTYVTASAGNHGMSVAAGAKVFGADAVIYLAETVPDVFADRLRAKGAKVMREGTEYEAAMAAAQKAASDNGWTLLSDSSWPGYFDAPHRLMEGYTALMAETVDALPAPPTHIFLQAGVGGLAAACAAYARHAWGQAPQIIVVEPDAAPAVLASVRAGECVHAPGPVSVMGRLDCKEPSLISLAGLARDADVFVTLSEKAVNDAMPILDAVGLATTPSGGAGLAAALTHGAALGLAESSRILCILSEEPE